MIFTTIEVTVFCGLVYVAFGLYSAYCNWKAAKDVRELAWRH